MLEWDRESKLKEVHALEIREIQKKTERAEELRGKSLLQQTVFVLILAILTYAWGRFVIHDS